MTAGPFTTEQQARTALVDTARRIAPAGLGTGRSGNLSLRWHRGGRDGLLATPSAADPSTLEPDDIAWIALGPVDDDDPADPDDALDPPPVWSGPRRPTSEWRIHHDLYAARPDAGGVVHLHSPYATTLACLPAVIDAGMPAFHYGIAVGGGDSVRCAPYAPFGSRRLARRALEAMHERQACLLAHHGMVATGTTLADAFERAIEVEALARVQWQAIAAGGAAVLDPADMRDAVARFDRYRPAS